MGVMQEGSTMGLGRLAVSAIRLCHCCGSPVYFCSRWSKPVCTRCSKLEGAEISSRFFFFPNMLENPEKPGRHEESPVRHLRQHREKTKDERIRPKG